MIINYYNFNVQQTSRMNKILDYEAIVKQLIQPPKLTYTLSNLGATLFQYQQTLYERMDFISTTKDNLSLQCSLFCQKQCHPRTILIYLHCNNGNRVQAMPYLNQTLKLDMAFLCFDSRGCGISDGQYITLGFREADDLQCIIKTLHNKLCKVNSHSLNIILWGRSMGAVTAINYMDIRKKRLFKQNIGLLVLDSPFLNLKQVLYESGRKRFSIPNILIDFVIKYLDQIIHKKIGLTIKDFDFRNIITNIQSSIILLSSKNDGLIPQNHFTEIYELHKGRKTIFYLDESHTDTRYQNTIAKVFKALNKYRYYEKNQTNQYFKTLRPQNSLQLKPCSSQRKISIASKDMILLRSNSQKRKRDLVTLRLYKTGNKQNQETSLKKNSLKSSRAECIKTGRVSQFSQRKGRNIKILNFRNLLQENLQAKNS